MATNTANLDLYKKDPLIDGNDYFDINTMLNENWDKIDSNAKTIDDRLKEVEEPTHGVQITTSNKVNHNSDALFGKYDLILEGETIVNILPKLNSVWETDKYTKTLSPKIYRPNTSLTIVNNSNKNIVMHLGSGSEGAFTRSITVNANSSQFEAFTDENIYQVVGTSASGWQNNTADEELFNSSIMILGDDYTNKDIEYFEDVRSAFEGFDEGGESVSENLFDKSKITQGYHLGVDGIPILHVDRFYSDYIKVKPNTTYSASFLGTFLDSYSHYFDINKNHISKIGVDGSTQQFTTPSNAHYVRISNNVTDLDTLQVIAGTTAPTTYTKHDSQALEIGKALQAVGVEGGLKRVGIAYDEVNGDKYIKRISDDIQVTYVNTPYTNQNGIDTLQYDFDCSVIKINGQIRVDDVVYDYNVSDGAAVNTWRAYGNNNLLLRLPTGTTPPTPITLIYQLAQEPDPIDLNLPTFNSFDKGTLIQSSKVPGTLTYTYPTNLGQTLKDVQDQLQDHENRLTVLDKYGSKPSSLDHTSSVEHIEANMSDTPTIEVTGNKLVPNLMGNIGDCEDTSYHDGLASTIALDSTDKVFGTNSIKATATLAATGFGARTKSNLIRIDNTKYYLVSAYMKNSADVSALYLYAYKNDGTSIKNTSSELSTSFKRRGLILAPSELTGETYILVYGRGVSNAIGDTVSCDGIMVNEITQSDYSNLSVDELLEKYPYRNSVQPLQNPTVEVVNGSLIPSFYEWDSIHSESTILSEDKLELNSTGLGKVNHVGIKVKKNTNYYLSFVSNAEMAVYNITGTGSPISTYSKNGRTFNTGDNEEIRVYWKNYSVSTGTFTLEKPMLIEGTTEKPYSKHSKGTVIFPTELCSENDKITWNGGAAASVEREWKKLVIDDSLTYLFNSDYTGYKVVAVASNTIENFGMIGYTSGRAYASKYDGTILSLDAKANGADRFDGHKDWGGADLVISISDTDTGWGETYTPTADEIKAYFMGWIMYNGDVNADTPYNGTGTKWWCSYDDSGAKINPTNQLPTTQAPSSNYWNPYQLFYQLEAKETEEIDVHIIGQAPIIIEGSNTVLVDSGLMYEKAKTTLYQGNYHINNTVLETEQTYKINKINKIIKYVGSVESNDKDNWTINSTNAYGNEKAYISEIDFDTTADYYILYEILDEEYNNQQVKATLTMEDNLRDSHENLERVVADNTKEIVQTKQELLDTYLKGDGERIETYEIATITNSSGNQTMTFVFDKAFTGTPKVIPTVIDQSFNSTSQATVILPYTITKTSTVINLYTDYLSTPMTIQAIVIGE